MTLGLIYFVGDALRGRYRAALAEQNGVRCLDWADAGDGALASLSAEAQGPSVLLDATGGPSGPRLAEMPPEQLPPGLAELHAAGRTRAVAVVEPAALFVALTADSKAEAHSQDHDHHRHDRHHHHDGEACDHDHGHEHHHHDHPQDPAQSHAIARLSLIASIEYADRVVVDTHGLSADTILELRRVLRALNGSAEVRLHHDEASVIADLAALPRDRHAAAAWQMVLDGDRPADFAALGLEVLVHRMRAPLHAQRLADFMARKFDGVIRAVGHFWLATRPDVVGAWTRCGTLSMAYPVGLWWASLPRDRWPPGAAVEIERGWQEPFGDRRQEFVFIGHGIDAAAIRAALDACALSEDEIGLGWQGWARLPDPFPAWAPAQH
jgi:hypothetical protein